MWIYLVRHGQSQGNLGIPGAPPDPDLTDIGRRQAACAAQAFQTIPVQALYASPMTRALRTASPIAETLGLPTRVWPTLAETDRGVWVKADPPAADPPANEAPASKDGLTLAEAQAWFPNTVPREGIALDAPWWRDKAGESRADTYQRAKTALADLQRAHPGEDDTIVVITHGAFGSVLMTTTVSAEPEFYNKFSQCNGGISLLAFTAEGPRLVFSNSVEHLPAELRTDLT